MSKQKIALVTGATSGLGFEWAKQLSERGYYIFATGRTQKSLDKLSSNFNSLNINSYETAVLNVTSDQNIKAIHDLIQHKKGCLDLLISNAGVSGNTLGFKNTKSQVKNTSDEILQMYNVNAVAPLILSHELVDLMPDGAKIINISSNSGSIKDTKRGGNYAYAMSKTAMNMATRKLAHDFYNAGVVVIALHPGWSKTQIGGEYAPDTPEQTVQNCVTYIETVSMAQTGQFLDTKGQQLNY